MSVPEQAIDREREFNFTFDDFERIRRLIYSYAGINLNPTKHNMVYSRLARRLRATGKSSFSEYLSWLEREDTSGEWQAFVNALTTNLTSFFREPHHFDTLSQYLRQHRDKNRIRLWCAACSTGEEAYSIAMIAAEAYNSFTPPVEIIASDLDTNVLAIAQQGVYSNDRLEKMSKYRISKFFLKGKNKNEGKVRICTELRNLVKFQQFNLLDKEWSLSGPFDAIFCRNILIYFDKVTQLKVLHKITRLLTPDGLLFVGHSESLLHASHMLRLRGKTVYELTPLMKVSYV